jgi:hypothetical protein
VTTSQPRSFTVTDTVPPVVTAVAAIGSGTSATVTWTTDETSTTRVDYGATTALGATATGASGTSHSVSLTGLANGATYYYRVTSADAAGNSTTDPVSTSAPRSFTIPDSVPPVVSAVAASGSGTSATVTWTTNESATSRVDYGLTTALGSTTTGATGTSHSVSLTGLTNGATYYYRVTSADAAGNSTTDPVSTSAPRTFTIPDTTPPVVSALAATGSGTSATVTWTTNESATTRVDYGLTTTLGSSATGTTGTSHSVTLTGLTVNTRYYYRVTSVDAAGNSTTSPATSGPPAAYVPTVTPVTQTSVSDFSTGSGAYVANSAGGEVLGTPTLGQEFTGTTLPSGWTSTALVTGGTSTFANGVATVSGSRLRTNTTWGAGSTFSAAVTLGAGQSVGWGSVAAGSTAVTASFSMSSTGALSAVVNDGGANNRTIAIAGTFTGAGHEYRIDRPTGNAVFFVDGTQVATSAFAPSPALLVMLVDPTTAAPTLATDWVRVGPYAASTTFTSAVLDAGATVGWDTLTSDSLVPANTTLTIQVRSGPNANSGSGSWTAWATVPANGSITRSSRYIQYRLQFTSTGSRFTTATVRSVALAFHVL